MVLGLVFDFGGTEVSVSGWFLLGFVAFTLLLVGMAIYFNRSVNHESEYVDERWGYGSIDDDEWGMVVADARRAVRGRLADLAERSDARERG